MSETTQPNGHFVRFELARRIEHIILIASFSTLALTGLPQKFVTLPISEFLIRLFGGIDTTRVIHHTAATIFVLEAVYHLVVMGYKMFVLRKGASMLPGMQDVKDGLQALAYNVGLAKQRPQMGRYSFDEKVEYWAMIWGLLLMGLTGFMLWNPIATTNFLPGVIIPAAKAAHGWEAVLAVAAILIWHSYHVHLRRFNKSIFTGKLTREEMEEDHPLELAVHEAGEVVAPPAEVVKRRRMIYIPIAAVVSVALLFGLYQFITLEVTALTTLPPAERAPVLQIQTPTPLPTLEPTPTSAAPAAGVAALTWDGSVGAVFQQKCGACHGTAGGLNLSDYADALKGGSQGPVIIAGNVDGSPLVAQQAAGGHPGQLSPEELDLVKRWIEAGAPQ